MWNDVWWSMKTMCFILLFIFTCNYSHKSELTHLQYNWERNKEKVIVRENEMEKKYFSHRFFLTRIHASTTPHTHFSLSPGRTSLWCERSESRRQGCVLGVWRVNNGSFLVSGWNPAGLWTIFLQPLRLTIMCFTVSEECFTSFLHFFLWDTLFNWLNIAQSIVSGLITDLLSYMR